jgi:hypothetical protein
MFHNWVEARAYMMDRQRELLEDAQAARRAAASRRDRRKLARKRRTDPAAPVIRPEIQEGGACC